MSYTPSSKYGDHDFKFYPDNDKENQNVGLRMICLKCDAFTIGYMHVRELRFGKNPNIMVNRALCIFRNKFPESCDETMVKIIHEL